MCINSFNGIVLFYDGHIIALNCTAHVVYSPLNSYFIYRILALNCTAHVVYCPLNSYFIYIEY